MTPPDAKTRAKHHIGGYRVIAPIGAGGFATVYRALDETTKAEVAIKVLAENHSLVPATRRRFVDEVGLLATINSPAIAKIYKQGETDTGQPFMVLELADRGDLRRRLEEIRGSHRVLNRSDLTMLAHHLYEALTTLHDADIVHRDVSPGNILIQSRRAPGRRIPTGEGGVTLLEPGERFLLADLGHAKDLILASGFTAGGGTRGYASPEQRDDITVVDHRADIFSATAVIEWAAHDGRFAKELEPFFDIGLAAEPDDRFTTMAEWHAAFCASLGANGHAARKTGSGWDKIRRKAAPLTDRLDGRPVLVGVIALVAIGAVALLGASALGNGTTTTEGSLDALAVDGPTSPSTEAPPELLRVKADGEEVSEDGPVALNAEASTTVEVTTSTEAPVETTSSTEATTTTIETTTTEEETTTTLAETTVTTDTSGSNTTIDPDFVNSPLAEVLSPADGTTVDGDLVVVGNATFPGGLRQVELIVRNLDTGLHWNPFNERFETDWLRFAIRVSEPAATEVSWQFVIPEDRLEPGNYLIRAWARGINGEGDPRSSSSTVTID